MNGLHGGWYDTVARYKANIPDGYELRAVDVGLLHFTATYRRKVDEGYDMKSELVYRVTDAGAFAVNGDESNHDNHLHQM